MDTVEHHGLIVNVFAERNRVRAEAEHEARLLARLRLQAWINAEAQEYLQPLVEQHAGAVENWEHYGVREWPAVDEAWTKMDTARQVADEWRARSAGRGESTFPRRGESEVVRPHGAHF